jgi:phosphate transport system permease protein
MTMITFAFGILLVAAVIGYVINRRAASVIRSSAGSLHSLPGFHGLYSALLVLVPTAIIVVAWAGLQRSVVESVVMSGLPDGVLEGLDSGAIQLILAEIRSIAGGRIFGDPEIWKFDAAERLTALTSAAGWLLVVLVVALSTLLVIFARRKVMQRFRARQGVENIVHGLMVFCATVAIFTTIGIVGSLVFEAGRFFAIVPIHEFLFGLNWEPQIAIRADQIASEGAFVWVPVFTGTLVITVVALFVAVPIGLGSAIYLHEFAPRSVRATVKPILEILAGVPTVVYGFFAVLTVAPALRVAGTALGLDVSPNTALAAGGVMAIMLIPFISSFADDALGAVPRALRDGALALGATRAETVLNVLFPAALPGIVGGILLAVSRAIGETMIVVMAAGLMANLTANPLDSVTTVTVQIVTMLIGDTSFDNPKTLSAFALGLMLFLATLIINIFALRIVRKYREAYD